MTATAAFAPKALVMIRVFPRINILFLLENFLLFGLDRIVKVINDNHYQQGPEWQ
jgi:hypothetical protein